MTELLDTRCTVETPEGIEFDSAVVGPVPRVLAYSIDFLWRALFLFVLSIVAGILGRLGEGIFLIAYFLLEWFYPVFFEVFKNGQTPGKKSMGIRVVNEDFTPVSLGASCVRNLLRAADILPFAYMLGLISIALSKRFQRLGDLAAGTIVIYVENDLFGVSPESIVAKPPSETLNGDEQKTIANFTLRTTIISESRQVELANILKPIHKKEGKAALEYMKSIGAWFLGGK